MPVPFRYSCTLQLRAGACLATFLRTVGSSLSGPRAARPADRLFRLHLGLHPRHARLHRRNDGAHGRHRRVRGAFVQHARPRGRLAGEGRSRQIVGHTAQAAARARCHPRVQHAFDSSAESHPPPNARRQFRHAPALGLPSQHARAKPELLPGGIRRPRRHEGHADRARRAGCLDDPRRHFGLRRHLLRHHRARRRRLQPLAALAVLGLAHALCSVRLVFRPAPRRRRQVPSRCPLHDDRPHHRCLYQHRNGQTVLAHPARERLCQKRHGRVPANRQPPNAHG
jgi:hypothetical protein